MFVLQNVWYGLKASQGLLFNRNDQKEEVEKMGWIEILAHLNFWPQV